MCAEMVVVLRGGDGWWYSIVLAVARGGGWWYAIVLVVARGVVGGMQ